jgi:hypothetical protein
MQFFFLVSILKSPENFAMFLRAETPQKICGGVNLARRSREKKAKSWI